VDLATRTLPLQAIALGPGEELGLGKAFEAHSCLDAVLSELRRFPSKGRSLILAGLRSPVVRNRNLAVAALANWDSVQRETLREVLERARHEEPDEELRVRMNGLLT
jgi:hypothetical protein